MKLIILAGYKPAGETDCPWLVDCGGLPLLEARVRAAFQVTTQPIVVLAGGSADLVLRRCRSLERCELVFDTNGESANVLTNLRAGLQLYPDPVAVLPAEVDFLDSKIFKVLRDAAVRDGLHAPDHIYQAVSATGDLLNCGFPMIVSGTGRSLLIKERDISSLGDPRIKYRYIAAELQSKALTHEENGL